MRTRRSTLIAALGVAGALLLLSSPLSSQRAGISQRSGRPVIQARYDSGSDRTVVTLLPVGGTQVLIQVGAAYECPGRANCVPAVVSVLLLAESPRPQYDGVRELTLAVDGAAPAQVLPAYQAQGSPRGDVLEMVAWQLPTDEFLKLARAGEVAYTLGPTSAVLTLAQRRGLAALADRIESGARD